MEDSVFSLRSTEIVVTSFRYFVIPSGFAEDSVSTLRSTEIVVTSFPYFSIWGPIRGG
ncbi:hypothetical protein PU629_19710 [Pullulanibacillus sp. KACC 23026]|uniref:hypothetical protein n=1 Tax=Pullulanibacillus sp. KACC 23026 TaxID=3028315 RepID=UPI0023AF2B5B|nr:hypothetical protein [Pullulanibacillus sp. KACC 23026]WEG12295.1 hypothetical protein PU629_19710 [Pullulanibacillus sp. KACC 23026]